MQKQSFLNTGFQSCL